MSVQHIREMHTTCGTHMHEAVTLNNDIVTFGMNLLADAKDGRVKLYLLSIVPCVMESGCGIVHSRIPYSLLRISGGRSRKRKEAMVFVDVVADQKLKWYG